MEQAQKDEMEQIQNLANSMNEILGNSGNNNTVTPPEPPQDTTPPTITVNKGTVDTSSIQVNVTSKDDQSGMPTSPTYNYYIKKSADNNYQSSPTYTGTQSSYTFTGLTQNTSYDVKVTTQDNAGNLGTGTLAAIKTTTVGGAGDGSGNIGTNTGNITASQVIWNPSTHKALVTLNTSTNLTIQYKVGASTSWTPALGTSSTAGKPGTVSGLNHNDIVYARLIDTAGNYGDEAHLTILDGINPTVTVNKGATTTSTVQVSVTSKDDQSGMPTNPTYSYYIKKSTDGTYPTNAAYTGTNTSHTFTGLTQNTSYDVKVTTVDNANNTGTGTATAIKTTTVGGAGDGSGNIGTDTGNITAGQVTWNPSTHKASVTLSTSTNLSIQYKVGSSGTWTPTNVSTSTAGKPVTVSGLNHNDIVYARLIDTAGNYGDEAHLTILDGINPTVTVNKGATTTSTVQVSVTSKDDQSGMPANPAYSYYIKKSTDGTYSTNAAYIGTNTSHTFTGLTQNTSYDVKVTTKDNANNTGTGTTTNIKTTTVEGTTPGLGAGSITAGTATWNKSTHKASVVLSTTTDKTIQYKIGEGGTYTPTSGSSATAGQSVTVSNLNHNDIVYARLVDEAGNYGSEAFITILDGIVPTAPNINLSTTNIKAGETLTATVTHTDDQSGVNTANSKYIWNTTSGTLGTTNASWNSATSFTSNPQTITLNTANTGTYYLHVLTTDNGGNKSENVSSAVTIEKPSSSDIIANASDKSQYYGKTVTGYTCQNSAAVANWKIFYAGSDFNTDGKNHIYLIADNYIENRYCPTASNGSALNTNGAYQAYFSNILGSYNGSSNITDARIKKLNNSYFSQNFTSTNNNMKSVAYMLDTSRWQTFKGAKADYAVGGPSVEMVMKSYSQKHNVDYRAKALNATGYQISKDGGSSWSNSIERMLSTSDSLYINDTSTSKAFGYWLASPSASGSNYTMIVDCNGNVTTFSYSYDFRVPPASLSLI